MPIDPPTPDWVLPRRRVLGRRIALLRAERGLVVDDVAGATGLDRKTVMAAENGHNAPTLDTLLLIAHALGVSVSELLNDDPAAATGASGGGA